MRIRVYLTINDVQRISEGKTFSYEDTIFKPSYRVMDICKSILKHEDLLSYYTAILECGCQTTSIYLQAPKRRHWRKKVA